MPSGTNTIFFIPKDKVPEGRKVTYGIIVAVIIPQKAETHRTRLTVGGNLNNFPGDDTTDSHTVSTVYLSGLRSYQEFRWLGGASLTHVTRLK